MVEAVLLVVDVVDAMLDSMGKGEGNFPASNWAEYQSLKESSKRGES